MLPVYLLESRKLLDHDMYVWTNLEENVLSAKEVMLTSPHERMNLILSYTNPVSSDSELDQAKELSRVINEFIEDYFELRIKEDRQKPTGSVLKEDNLAVATEKEINAFKPLAIERLKQAIPTEDMLVRSLKNLYEMSGAVKLAFANKATRNLSTTMGLLWERIASISPYAVNPEIEFNLKIKGIDLIAKNINTGNIEY